MTALHDGAGRNGEVLAALGIAAAVTTGVLGGVVTLRLAAPMADRAVGPQNGLECCRGDLVAIVVAVL